MAVERALFMALLPKFAKQGLSGAAMIRRAKAMGIPTYRFSVMYEDIRSAKQKFFYMPQVIKFPEREIIPNQLMSQVKLRKEYKYRVYYRYQVYSEVDRSYVDKLGSFYTDTQASKEDYLDETLSILEGVEGVESEEVEEVGIVLVEHNRGARY